MMKNVLLVICFVCVLSFANAQELSSKKSTCAKNCTIPTGYGKSACDWYAQDYPTSWLPAAYAASAQCACLGNESAAWDSATAQCVRAQVRIGTGAIDPVVQGTLASLKVTDCGLIYCSDRYYQYVYANFIPQIYQIHVNAYKTCCCPGTPAPLVAWNYIISSYQGFVPCDYVVAGIEAAGQCGCQGW